MNDKDDHDECWRWWWMIKMIMMNDEDDDDEWWLSQDITRYEYGWYEWEWKIACS